jgi:hypothetical protein
VALERLCGFGGGAFDEKHFFDAVDFLELHFDNFDVGGLDDAADKFSFDRELAVPAVDEDEELDARGTAVVEKGVQCGANGAAGVEHVIHQNDVFAGDRKRNVRGTHNGFDTHGAEIVAVEVNIENADWNCPVLEGLDLGSEALRHGNAAAANANERKLIEVLGLLQNLVREPDQGSIDLGRTHELRFFANERHICGWGLRNTGYHVGNGSVTFRLGTGWNTFMRLLWLAALALPSLYGQNCAPARILAAGTVTGTLDNSSCFLSDATAYAAYRLDLPTRGNIAVTLSTPQDFLLILRDASGAKIDGGAGIQRPIEAGQYTLLVNARVPGQAGDLSVKTSFTPEPGTLCSAFPGLGVNQATSGILGTSGCALPDGTVYEAYLVHTRGAGTLTVTATSTDFAPTLFLRTPDGAEVAAGDGSFSTPVDGDTAYEVVIATLDKTGAFGIASTFEAADGETCRPVKSLKGPASEAGNITADSCTATLPASGEVVFYNYYGVTVDAPGLADFGVTSSDFLPTVNLFDDGGNRIAADTGGGAASGSGIRMQLQPGTYTLEIVSTVLSGRAYQLNYGFTPGAPQPCVPATAAPGDGLAATLSSSSCRTGMGLADVYTMTLPAAGTLDLTMSTDTALTGAIAIRDLKDNLIVMTEDAQGLAVTRLTADLPAGSYTILAGAALGAGIYQMTSKFTAQAIAPCTSVQPLDINGGYVKKLSTFSCRGTNGGPIDWYEFTLPADGVVAMNMTSSEVDGYLTLTDTAGNTLRSDDNSYGFGDPLMIQYLAAGTYRLAARPASGTEGGLYEVDVRSILGPRPPFCRPTGAIPMNGSVTGTITFGSCQYTDATFADIYKIEVTDSSSVDIRLTSSAFDASLLLLDAKGNLVDRDDDSGGGTNARINRLLAPGTYYVVAKPEADYTAGGSYTLSVQ